MDNSPQSALVEQLRTLNEHYDARLLDAFSAVDRGTFIDQMWAQNWLETGQSWQRCNSDQSIEMAKIYTDAPIVTAAEGSVPLSSSTRPSLMADMLQELDIQSGDRVLEIGTGIGYNAAIMAMLARPTGAIQSYELDNKLAARARANLRRAGTPAESVKVVCGDGFSADLSTQAFNKIIATVACGDVSSSWLRALSQGGKLVVPLDHAGVQPLVAVQILDNRAVGHVVGWSTFMQGQGMCAPTGRWPSGIVVQDVAEVPIIEQQMWPTLGNGKILRYLDLPQDEADFFFHLALHDSSAVWTPWGIGLTTGPAWVAVSRGILRAQGDEVSRNEVLEKLQDAFAHWNSLGRPGAENYELEFVPLSADKSRYADATVVVRRDHATLYRLQH
jgi:protein-L-isoaspartate(D-aspartate) O-methyltransferase